VRDQIATQVAFAVEQGGAVAAAQAEGVRDSPGIDDVRGIDERPCQAHGFSRE
jgi:hypothetical protein